MRYVLIPALLLASGSAFASEEQYTLDSDHTYPSMEVPHMGLSVFRGKFNRTTGKATIDHEARTGTIEAHIDTASIDFGHDKVNEHLRTAEFFDVAKHPEAVYRGKLVFEGDKVVAVDGELTLLGTTKPLRLAVSQFQCVEHFYFKKPWCAGDASAQLDRADFGMGRGAENGLGWVKLQIQFEAGLAEDKAKPAG